MSRFQRRRGSLMVTSFVVVIGLMVMAGGLHTMLKTQIERTGEARGVALSQLQALYLAEMGLNAVMFEANRAANAGSSDPFPLAVGNRAAYDFTAQVALANEFAGGSARCEVERLAAPGGRAAFTARATLVSAEGTFERAVSFETQRQNGAWVVASYALAP